MTLLLFKKPSFLSRTSSSLFRRKTNSKKIWPNSLDKCFFEYPQMTFFKSRKTSFLSGTSSNIISRPFFFFLKKNNLRRNFQFLAKSWVNPFRKMDISHCVEMTCFLSRKPIFPLRALLNIVSRSFSCANGVKCTNCADCLHRLYCLYRLETAWIVRSKPIALTVSIVLIVLIAPTILIVLAIRTLWTYLLCWLYRL